MFVHFWDVAATKPIDMPMSLDDICRHLAVDWIPSLPPADGKAFIGWPPFLIKALPSPGNKSFLTLRSRARGSERQWKIAVSWMLGVAGARQFLSRDGYIWVAPCSAFYRRRARARWVDTSPWPPEFPEPQLLIRGNRTSGARLRPDYIAIRASSGNPGRYEWAVAEAKGVRTQLAAKPNCPADWYRQARNVTLVVDDSEVAVPRHLVIALLLANHPSISTHG